jgi:hypothetical protein
LYKHAGVQKVQQIEGQIAELLAIVSDDPHNATILAEIGELYLVRLNQPAAAFPYLEQALSNCPGDERIERLYHLARYRLAYRSAHPLDFTFQNATPSAAEAIAMTSHFEPVAPPWSTVAITTGVSANDPSWIDTLSIDSDGDELGD